MGVVAKAMKNRCRHVFRQYAAFLGMTADAIGRAVYLAAADTAVASLEQQYSYLFQMFQQMQADQQNGG